MIQNLTEKEIDFYCSLRNPVWVKETLYPANLKSCHTWKEDDCELYKIRAYQISWQPWHWMICNDKESSNEQNLKKKRLCGTLANLGARDIGKSYDFLQAEAPIHIILNDGKESCLISATSGFLKKVSRPIINIFREHPFFKLFQKGGKGGGINASENMEIQAKNGHVFYGRNEKISDPEPGEKVQGLHYENLWYEEFSYATKKGEAKRIDSGTSVGEVERFSGIPDVRLDSPLGNIFHNKENKRHICRLPQFIREDWSEEQKKRRADSYNGETSLAYKLNVVREITEGAEAFWDLVKIKELLSSIL